MRARSELCSRIGRAARGRAAIRMAAAGSVLALAGYAGPEPARAGPADDAAAPSSVEAEALDTTRPAAAGAWVVLQATGRATWRPQGSTRWLALAHAQVLPAGSEVETGPTGDLILVLGGDRLVVGPNSRLAVPARDDGQDRRLRVERGRLRVDVESRPGRDVEVRTPLLSLGIKGTSIEVAVDGEQSSVVVIEGRITATAPGEDPADLDAGDGLRQRAEPGALPERLTIEELPARVDRGAPTRWHLPPPGTASTAAAPAGSGPIGSAAAAPLTAAQPPATPGRDPSAPRWSAGPRDGWMDDQTSLLTVLLIAAAGLMILVVPGVALGHNLRQQWRGRPGAKGRRRRGLVEG